LNSSFKLHNVHSSSQKSQTEHFVMLLPCLGNEEYKVNTNIFENGPISSFQNFYKIKGPYFFSIFLCFNFLLINKLVLYLFHVYCRLTFDPGAK